MKILCDENLPHDLRACLAHHDVYTVAYLGWGGIKNGKLLDAAEADGFDLLLTGDKTIEYEQNLKGRRISIVALSAVNWPVIEPNLPAIIRAVDSARRERLCASSAGRSAGDVINPLGRCRVPRWTPENRPLVDGSK